MTNTLQPQDSEAELKHILGCYGIEVRENPDPASLGESVDRGLFNMLLQWGAIQRLAEAKLARKQFTEAVDDSDFIVANGERISQLAWAKVNEHPAMPGRPINDSVKQSDSSIIESMSAQELRANVSSELDKAAKDGFFTEASTNRMLKVIADAINAILPPEIEPASWCGDPDHCDDLTDYHAMDGHNDCLEFIRTNMNKRLGLKQ